MQRAGKTLAELFNRIVASRSEDMRMRCKAFDLKERRAISRLTARGVTTVSELIAALTDLPPKLKEFGISWLQWHHTTRAAESTLLKMLYDDPKSRWSCASALGSIGGARSTRAFIQIAKTQLASPSPDRHWLNAVIQGLKMLANPPVEVEEVLLAIYERTDLPGWLRGDAGDALGCCSQLNDRQTRFFHRAWATARSGLDDPDIEVQFWSMYVIMQLAQNHSDLRRSNARFAVALPRLRQIAATDHRLAPGYWWPMSGEAEDAIYVIKHGNGRENDAGQRWLGNPERGAMIRDVV